MRSAAFGTERSEGNGWRGAPCGAVPEVVAEGRARPGAGASPDGLYEEVARGGAGRRRWLRRWRRRAVLIAFLNAALERRVDAALAKAGVTAFAMEAIPRISRAQGMDALSSQSNVAGYRAALLGAEHIGRFFPMLMTAAGTIPPAKVLVLGAGVAGLQALATARRLGAQTTGYDVRPEVAEQVSSLGAKLARSRDRGGRRGRLRARPDRRGAGRAAAGPDRRDQGLRRRHHDRARARAPGAEAGHRRSGRGHETGQRDRRSGRRDGRQLRADDARRGDRRARRHDRLAAEPRGRDARARLAALRAQRPGAARAVPRRAGRSWRSTSTTRSSPAPASCATARSSTRARARSWKAHA
jgi:hypothetical protein